ncbi:DedA family protein [Chryseoglobus sp. 28M-23]|uniref:DedA family protein n=1 Tax=Chryseoglobus sp. 28M-23 TaxID=2772253 RepID=UPI001CD15830|nr:DedA family protein [Chryseoglobus sp. 28M-23]
MLPMDIGLFDVEGIITGAGPWALAVVCLIVFVETGLLVGFLLPGDTLLILTGVLTFTGVIPQPIWLVALCIMLATMAGDNLGYLIGRKVGPPIFERKSAGFFSRRSVARTEAFFAKYGGWAVTIARFIAVVRTISPVAAGVGKMQYRKFFLFDTLGAALWGVGLPALGYSIAQIPGVAAWVVEYIDLVLIILIGLVLIGIGYHWFHERHQQRKEDELERQGVELPPVEIWQDEPEHDGKHEAKEPASSRRTYGIGPHDGKHEKNDELP